MSQAAGTMPLMNFWSIWWRRSRSWATNRTWFELEVWLGSGWQRPFSGNFWRVSNFMCRWLLPWSTALPLLWAKLGQKRPAGREAVKYMFFLGQISSLRHSNSMEGLETSGECRMAAWFVLRSQSSLSEKFQLHGIPGVWVQLYQTEGMFVMTLQADMFQVATKESEDAAQKKRSWVKSKVNFTWFGDVFDVIHMLLGYFRVSCAEAVGAHMKLRRCFWCEP